MISRKLRMRGTRSEHAATATVNGECHICIDIKNANRKPATEPQNHRRGLRCATLAAFADEVVESPVGQKEKVGSVVILKLRCLEAGSESFKISLPDG